MLKIIRLCTKVQFYCMRNTLKHTHLKSLARTDRPSVSGGVLCLNGVRNTFFLVSFHSCEERSLQWTDAALLRRISDLIVFGILGRGR